MIEATFEDLGGWDLGAEPIRVSAANGSELTTAQLSPLGLLCRNGHVLQTGDEMCLVCGAPPAEESGMASSESSRHRRLACE